MTLNPREQHVLEQFEAFMAELGTKIGALRRAMIDAGASEEEASEVVREIGRRLGGPRSKADPCGEPESP